MGTLRTILPCLRELWAKQAALGAEGLASLAGLTNLMELWLSNTQVSGRGLAKLAVLPTSHTIRLAGTPVSDKAVKYLVSLSHLKSKALGRSSSECPASASLSREAPDKRFDTSVARRTSVDVLRVCGILLS
jgi:hypothetical protein